MLLALLPLESRLTPSAYAVGGGVVHVRTGWEVYAFEDFRGPLNVLDAGPEVAVGAGSGGGPRVRIFDKASGAVLSDQFLGDPSSRSGVVPFGVPVPTGEPQDVPHLSEGNPSDFTVFVDYDRPPSVAFVKESFAAIPPYFLGLPVSFTTDRPRSDPRSYATVVVGADPSWAAPSAAGVSPFTGGYRSGIPAEVAPGYSPELTGEIAAHELGHLLGLDHSPDPANLMYPTASLSRRLSAADDAAILHTLTGV